MSDSHPLYTIGFTQKTAAEFFGLLESAGVETVIDVRANNTSQLAAFTKRTDLPYFLDRILGVDYLHWEFLAPTPEIRDMLKDRNRGWSAYELAFESLMRERDILGLVDKSLLRSRRCCLLCSEPTADQCHRRLVAERLAANLSQIEVRHL
jgi:uncharacterized protein (DUF488 family)